MAYTNHMSSSYLFVRILMGPVPPPPQGLLAHKSSTPDFDHDHTTHVSSTVSRGFVTLARDGSVSPHSLTPYEPHPPVPPF